MHSSRSHDAVIRVYDTAGYVIETHDHAGWSLKSRNCLNTVRRHLLRGGALLCRIYGRASPPQLPRTLTPSERKSFAKKLMPLLWQKNGTKTQPGKIRSNYRLDNSSRARLFVCACRHGLIREERRRGS